MEAEQVENLVVAVLAVGGYSLDRAWSLLAKLRDEGLTNPTSVEAYDEAEVVRRLIRSGYDRGPIVTTSMARRVIALHAGVREGVLRQVVRLMRDGRFKDAEEKLCSLKGIGPTVYSQFAMLEISMK